MNKPCFDRTAESEIRPEILDILMDGKIRSNAQLKKRIRETFSLMPGDKKRANERPNEEKWEELVNNALSPSRSNSLPATRLTEVVERGQHRITQEGREYVENEKRENEAIFDEVFKDVVFPE